MPSLSDRNARLCDAAFRYLDNKVFVSLANGDITVYTRDHGTIAILDLVSSFFDLMLKTYEIDSVTRYDN